MKSFWREQYLNFLYEYPLILGFGFLLFYGIGQKEHQDEIARQQLAKAMPQIECLAKNMYFESRGEPLVGQIAVAKVTMNRVQSGDYPKTVCGVVYQPYQFSWTIDKQHRVHDKHTYNKMKKMAADIYLEGQYMDPTEGSKFFYAHNTLKRAPKWANQGKKIIISNHTFIASR